MNSKGETYVLPKFIPFTAFHTCQAENISCRNRSSRSGLAVTNHFQHSMAVVIAGSVKSSICDHATTCSRLRYTSTKEIKTSNQLHNQMY